MKARTTLLHASIVAIMCLGGVSAEDSRKSEGGVLPSLKSTPVRTAVASVPLEAVVKAHRNDPSIAPFPYPMLRLRALSGGPGGREVSLFPFYSAPGLKERRTIELRNVGLAPAVNFLMILETGSNGGFRLDTTGMAQTLNYQETTTFVVEFCPQVVGNHSLLLTVFPADEIGEEAVCEAFATSVSRATHWRLSIFNATDPNGADDSDPDLDGVINLMEFAQGSHPLQSRQPLISLSPPSEGFLNYHYLRTIGAQVDGFLFIVEWNDTLDPLGWHTDSVNESIISQSDSVQQVQARIPVGGSGNRFVRLRVVPPVP